MAIILASTQICSPLFFGFEHSACQLGTVAVFKPFPKPRNICLRSTTRQGDRVHTGNNTANDELVSGQVLYATIRYLGETQGSRHDTYSWYRGDLYYRSDRNKKGPYDVSQHGCSEWEFQNWHTDVHVPSPSNFVPIKQGEERSKQTPDLINRGIERLHG